MPENGYASEEFMIDLINNMQKYRKIFTMPINTANPDTKWLANISCILMINSTLYV